MPFPASSSGILASCLAGVLQAGTAKENIRITELSLSRPRHLPDNSRMEYSRRGGRDGHGGTAGESRPLSAQTESFFFFVSRKRLPLLKPMYCTAKRVETICFQADVKLTPIRIK